jgi:transcriptional repressor NrdR
MRCPYCDSEKTRVVDTTHDSRGGIRRRRECKECNERFSTYERAIMDTPLLIKQDGSREPFDREKLERGIQVACAKRPVAAVEIQRLVGEIESYLQRLGKLEVSSRIVGDMVITGLKEMDHIAYIRYAIVYLKLDDLASLRAEIDHLLETE